MSYLLTQTENKTAKAVEAVRELGFPAVATTENRAAFRRWLNGLGIPSADYESMSLATLTRCYTKPSYLLAVARNKGATDAEQRALSGRAITSFMVANTDAKAWTEYKSGDDQGEEPKTEKRPDYDCDECGKTVPQSELSHEEGRGAICSSCQTKTETQEEEEDEVKTQPQLGTDPLSQAIGQIVGQYLDARLPKNGQKLDEAAIVAIIKKNVPHFTVDVTKGEEKRRLPEGLRHSLFPTVLQVVGAARNVMLVGPAGSGKTTLAHQIADALELPFFFNGAIASEFKLSGFIDAQGRIVSTPFRKAYTEGGVYLFDELDASMPGAVMAFNAALANGHADFPDGAAERHPDFRVIAAANTYGRGADRQYVGRFQLDAATLDRFAVLDLDYDEKLERAAAGNDAWVDTVQELRRKKDRAKVRHIISPRASIEGAKLLAAGLDEKLVLEMEVWKGIPQDDRNRINAA